MDKSKPKKKFKILKNTQNTVIKKKIKCMECPLIQKNLSSDTVTIIDSPDIIKDKEKDIDIIDMIEDDESSDESDFDENILYNEIDQNENILGNEFVEETDYLEKELFKDNQDILKKEDIIFEYGLQIEDYNYD